MLSTNVERVRSRLHRDLFPDPPPPPEITAHRSLVFAGLALLAVVIEMARMWSSAPLNSIWAEDGAIWLRDAMKGSFVHAATTPYNGYLQLVSRLVAVPVAKLPVGWFAPAMGISGAAIVCWLRLYRLERECGSYQQSLLARDSRCIADSAPDRWS